MFKILRKTLFASGKQSCLVSKSKVQQFKRLISFNIIDQYQDRVIE
jgi:hypothetical protein